MSEKRVVEDERYELLAELLLDGVPRAMVEELEALLLELDGVLIAEGWMKPPCQAQFVAERLERYAARFREMADG